MENLAIDSTWPTNYQDSHKSKRWSGRAKKENSFFLRGALEFECEQYQFSLLQLKTRVFFNRKKKISVKTEEKTSQILINSKTKKLFWNSSYKLSFIFTYILQCAIRETYLEVILNLGLVRHWFKLICRNQRKLKVQTHIFQSNYRQTAKINDNGWKCHQNLQWDF